MSFQWNQFELPDQKEIKINWKSTVQAQQYNDCFRQFERLKMFIDEASIHFEQWSLSWHQLHLGLIESEIKEIEKMIQSIEQIENEKNENRMVLSFDESKNHWSNELALDHSNHRLCYAKQNENIKSDGTISVVFANAKNHTSITSLDYLKDENQNTYWEHQIIKKLGTSHEKIVKPSWYRAEYSDEDGYVVLEYRFFETQSSCPVLIETIDGLKCEVMMIESVDGLENSMIAQRRSTNAFFIASSFIKLRIYLRQRFSIKQYDQYVFRFGLKRLDLDFNHYETKGSWVSKIVEIQEPSVGIAIETIQTDLPQQTIQYQIGCVNENELLAWIPIQPKNQRFAYDVLEHPIQKANEEYVWFYLRMKAKNEMIVLYRGKDQMPSQFYVYEDQCIGYPKTMYEPSISLICEYEPLEEERVWIPKLEAKWFVRPSGERGESFKQLSNQYAITLQQSPWIDLNGISNYEEALDRFVTKEPDHLLVLVNGIKYKNITDYTMHPNDRDSVVRVPDSYVHIGQMIYFPVVLFEESIEIEVHYQVMKLPIVIQVKMISMNQSNRFETPYVDSLTLLKVEGDL